MFKGGELRIKLGIMIFTIVFNLQPNLVFASAGYYSIEKGDVLRAEVCIPKSTKPPLILQIYNGSGKPLSVARTNSFTLSSGICGKNEKRVFVKWKVDRNGEYSLSFYSPKTKNSFYGWPDGIAVIG